MGIASGTRRGSRASPHLNRQDASRAQASLPRASLIQPSASLAVAGASIVYFDMRYKAFNDPWSSPRISRNHLSLPRNHSFCA